MCVGGSDTLRDFPCAFAGTVYRNRMINVMLTNVKLYHRASRIVSDVTGIDIPTGMGACCWLLRVCDGAVCEGRTCATLLAAVTLLQRAIYTVDAVPAELAAVDVSEHVSVASTRARVVPLAICLALGKGADGAALTVAEAQEKLLQQPVLRRLIVQLLGSK